MTALRGLVDVPPLWLAGAVALAFAESLLWPASWDWGGFGRVAGWAFLALGLAGIGWAARTMARARTTILPQGQPSALVTGGPFRYSRNPIYLADAALLLGAILLLGALVSLALLPLFLGLVTRRFIRPEEARLLAAFGPDYAAYRALTPRWL